VKPETGEEEVTVTLTRFEWLILLRGGRHLRKKSERQLRQNPDFVPEPGKTDVNREYIRCFNSATDKIEAVWGRPFPENIRK
jgi:hypothetical protein